MTAAAIQSQKHRWTLPEFRKAWEAGVWPEYPAMELIDGEVFFMPSDGFRTINWNQAVNRWLCQNLPDTMIVVPDKTLPVGEDAPKPDFWIYPSHIPVEQVTARETVLVIEVSDTTLAWDIGGKAARYALGGTPEYWVIDVAAACLHIFTLQPDGNFGPARIVDADTAVSPQGLPGIAFKLSQLKLGPTV